MTREGRDESADARAWDAIVADLSGQLDFSAAMAQPGAPVERVPEPDGGDAVEPIREDPELLEADAGGYHPPEPPPISLPSDLVTRFAWAGAIGGPAVLIAASLLGLGGTVAGAGVAAAIAGFALLVARMRDERDDDGPHGGAVV